MKVFATIIPTNIVTKPLLSLFGPFVETKNKNQVFRSSVVS